MRLAIDQSNQVIARQLIQSSNQLRGMKSRIRIRDREAGQARKSSPGDGPWESDDMPERTRAWTSTDRGSKAVHHEERMQLSVHGFVDAPLS